MKRVFGIYGMLALTLATLAPTGPARAACAPDSAGFAYLSPFFAGIPWHPAADTIDMDVPDALCTLKPVSYGAVGTRTSGLGFAGGANGALSLISLSSSPRSLCARALFSAADPRALPVTAPGGVVCVLSMSGTGEDSAAVAVLGAPDRILAYHVNSAAQVTRVDTLNLTALNAGQAVTGLAVERWAGSEKGLWAFGSSGLVRFFPLTGAQWGGEEILDIVATENVTAAGESLLGTASGKVYRKPAAGGFVLEPSGSTRAIRAISAKGAVGDNGLVLVRGTTQWLPYTSGNANYRGFNLVKRPNGSAVELLTQDWVYSSYVYSETATSLGFKPDSLTARINKGQSVFVYGPPEVTVVLTDPDSNFAVPRIVVKSGATRRSLTAPGGADSLQKAAPGSACASGQVRLASGQLSITIRTERVELRADAVAGVYYPTCKETRCVPRAFTSSQPWTKNDQLVVTLGRDSLVIVNQLSGATNVLSTAGNGRATPANVARFNCGRLILSNQGLRSLGISSVDICDAAGRVIASVSSTGCSASVSRPVAGGLLWARYRFADGTRVTQALTGGRQAASAQK